MRDSAQKPAVETLAALRQRISTMENARTTVAQPDLVPLGHAGIDAALEGGLECGRLHEIYAGDAADASCAAGFAAMLTLRLAPGAMWVWLRLAAAQRAGGCLHAPGLAELGIDPGRLVLGVLPDALSLLRVAAEVARCPDVGVLVMELWRTPRELDLTASRRLAVAAEHAGVSLLMLRVAAEPSPSAAHTRWSVRAVPAVPLAANAPGFPALDLQLLRRRGRSGAGQWQVEWDRDQAIFRDPASIGNQDSPAPVPGPMVPVFPRRPAAPERRRTG